MGWTKQVLLWMSILGILMPGILGIDWTSALPDGAVINVCQGSDLALEWNITVDSGEEITEIRWFLEDSSRQLIAVFTADSFLQMPSFSGRVQHEGGADIILHNVMGSDAGNYSVDVIGHDAGNTQVTLKRTVTVHVATEAPAAVNGRLQATQRRTAERDMATGQWHVALACGNLTTRGQPPVDAVWTTPLGQTLPSSDYVNGKFILLLPNPVQGGNYTCQITLDAPATVCLASDDPLLDEARVSVDEQLSRLTLVEAQQRDILDENNRLKEELQREKEHVNHTISSLEERLENETSELRNELQEERESSHHTITSLQQSLEEETSLKNDALQNVTLLLERVRQLEGGKRGIRLVGSGNSPTEGRVEVEYNGKWGTICDDMWDAEDAQVACSMLGYSRSGARVYGSAHFGQGRVPILLDDVRCTGSESHIFDCAHRNPLFSSNCDHDEDAGLSCRP